MGEDYTYTETEPTRAQLAARVRELERENAELRAKWDAVPVEELRFWWDPFRRGLTAEAINKAGVTIETWLKAQPDDDPDAPLILAAIDGEDGDL